MMKYNLNNIVTLLLFTFLSACTGQNVQQMPVEKIIYKPKDIAALEKTKKSDTNIIRDFLGINDKYRKRKNNSIEESNIISTTDINPYLWRASLNILSSLTSLSEINQKSGIISTDWYTSKKMQFTRYKISALIENGPLKKDTLDIRIYKHVFKNNN